MKMTAWVTIASLLMYIWIIANVGKARALHKISAPYTEGPPEFLAVLRVQANTVEQLVLFLPLLWLCCYYLNDRIAAVLGATWVVGRIVYALGYYREPAKRSMGFGISTLAGVGLLIGAIVGLFR